MGACTNGDPMINFEEYGSLKNRLTYRTVKFRGQSLHGGRTVVRGAVKREREHCVYERSFV